MTREQSIAKALEKKSELLYEKKREWEKAEQQLADENFDYAAVCREMKECGARLARTALGGDKEELERLKEKLCALSNRKKQMLSSAGISDIKYDCEICRDTGKAAGKICECVKAEARRIILSDISKTAPIEKSGFDSFNLSYYEDVSAKKRMTAILKLAREYALSFDDSTRENLLFMGNTGLGKTHLSLAIMSEVAQKGYDVIYASAHNLFSEIETEHFSLHTNTKYEDAVSCDLLVIDDFGQEFVSPYIQTLVYNILNTRLLGGKPTVINTNLSMKEIEKIYTPRVASRLIGEYTAKMFLGEDVRQIKAFGKA